MNTILKTMAVAIMTCGLAILPAKAQVSVGVGFGQPNVIVEPACQYGYYDYAPYGCAPYGYYGPDYFVNGVFVGVGPWYNHHGFYRDYGHPGRAGVYRGNFRGGERGGGFRGHADHGHGRPR